MNKQIESEQTQSEPELYTLLEAVRFAYGQYKLDLKYVKNTSNSWIVLSRSSWASAANATRRRSTAVKPKQ